MIELDILHIRILFALAMLGTATIIDIRSREISDFLWIVFGGISVVLLFFEPNIIEAAFGVGFSLIVAPLVLILWRFGLFGGADALGLIVLSALAPMATLTGSVVSPFSIVVNSALLSVSPMIFNFIRNSILVARKEDIFQDFDETTSKKIFAMFLGYRSKNPKYSFSLETQVGKKKRLNIALHHSDTAEYCTTPDTWVTPGLPFMIFILGGFIIQLFFGDVVLRLIGLT
ncbi:MAG: A24 family peptidase C-terminal domain-containing protein [Nitrosopumilus sp.]|jgi:preflagellin peptidase FlaK|uniref:Prepilin peptidase n=1 Tax=Candidatus Nitrosomaritimum aestuariumsis TaxID=3342354 RepID=A0AC60W8A9_9ARCH|nr:prepilin peptidase [Nitrosopumilaceae archaeon]MBA4463592.1 prepilin peptidase [Nitrosopumilaceae archaeon]NCF22123.1 peptidase [Nitrosopumilaceae archaeon]